MGLNVTHKRQSLFPSQALDGPCLVPKAPRTASVRAAYRSWHGRSPDGPTLPVVARSCFSTGMYGPSSVGLLVAAGSRRHIPRRWEGYTVRLVTDMVNGSAYVVNSFDWATRQSAQLGQAESSLARWEAYFPLDTRGIVYH